MRQDIREWLFWEADRLYAPLYGWYGVELGRRKLLPLSFDDAVITRWNTQGEASLKVLDAHLGDRRFLVGTEPTIADICAYADIAFAKLSGRDLAEWLNVAAWASRLEALLGFAEPFDLLAMQDAVIAAGG
jgi:glutathione S-transferase